MEMILSVCVFQNMPNLKKSKEDSFNSLYFKKVILS